MTTTNNKKQVKIMKEPSVYIVSLPWASQRRKRIASQLDDLGLSYKMVDAVDGHFILPYERLRNKLHLVSKFKSRLLTAGEQGAVLSHHKVYEMMLHNNDEHALILEDDANINADIKALLNNLEQLPTQWNICYLGYFYDTLGEPLFKAAHYPIDLWGSKNISLNSTDKPPDSHYKMGKFIVRPRGAFGYMLTKKAAKLLLQEHTQRHAALIADRALSNAPIPGLVGIAPALISHDNARVEECITQRPPSNFKHRTLNRDLNRLASLLINLVPLLKSGIYSCRGLVRRLRASALFIISRQYNRYRLDYEV